MNIEIYWFCWPVIMLLTRICSCVMPKLIAIFDKYVLVPCALT